MSKITICVMVILLFALAFGTGYVQGKFAGYEKGLRDGATNWRLILDSNKQDALDALKEELDKLQ